MTREVTVERLYDYPLRQGGYRFEAWCKPIDGEYPREVVASTFDPFTADLLGLARLNKTTVYLTYADSNYGMDIIRAELTKD